MKKRNFEDEYNHVFDDYMTPPMITKKILSMGISIMMALAFMRFILPEMITIGESSKDLEGVMIREMITFEKVLEYIQIVITGVLLTSQFSTWNNLLTLVRYQPPKNLMKKMVLPIIVFYLSIGIGSLAIYLLANYGTDSQLDPQFTLYFIIFVMFLYCKNYFLYSKNMEVFKKERELEEMENQ